MFSHHSDQMSQRSKVSLIALWRYSLNVIVIAFVFVFAFVFLLCFCWSGHVSPWPHQFCKVFGLVWKAGRLWIRHSQYANIPNGPFFLQIVKCPYVTSPTKIFGWLLLPFGGVWEAFFPRLGRFAEYVVESRKMWLKWGIHSFGGELFGKPLARNF